MQIRYTDSMLPKQFQRFLWSQDVAQMDPTVHRKTIVMAAINYGDLEDWRWLLRHYGRDGLARTFHDIPHTALRAPAAKLAQLLFGIERIPDVPQRPLA